MISAGAKKRLSLITVSSAPAGLVLLVLAAPVAAYAQSVEPTSFDATRSSPFLRALKEAAERHPERIAYVKPPHPTGVAFVLEFIAPINSVERNNPLRSLDARVGLDHLADIQRLLWRKGRDLPASSDELIQLYHQREIDAYPWLADGAWIIEERHGGEDVASFPSRVRDLPAGAYAMAAAAWADRFGAQQPVCGCTFRHSKNSKLQFSFK